jgi:hypothetical protein
MSEATPNASSTGLRCALQVLNEGEHGAGVITSLQHARSNRLLAQEFKRTETAFAGNELIAVLYFADRDRLEEAFRTNRFGQFLDTSLIELTARLTGVRYNGAECNLNECQAGSDGSGSRRRGRCYGLGNAATNE